MSAAICSSMLGHKYEARYDEVPLTGMKLEVAQGSTAEGVRSLYIRRVYIHDICTRCGSIIVRAK